MARVTDVFSSADGVIPSTLTKIADGMLRRPAVKLALVFSESFWVEVRADDVGARDIENGKT